MATPSRIRTFTNPLAPTPAPAVPNPNPTTPAPSTPIFGSAINPYTWGDKMFGGSITSMEQAQQMFDKIWKIDPRLAYNFLGEIDSWNPEWNKQFGAGGVGRNMRPWIQKQYFNASMGGDPNTQSPEMLKYNTWINMSDPSGSNAPTISPQEKYWMYQMINQGNANWATELDPWFQNAPGGYYANINKAWTPQTLDLGDVYGGIYQNSPAGQTPRGNPYLQAMGPNSSIKPNPVATRGPGVAVPNPTPFANPGSGPISAPPAVPSVAAPPPTAPVTTTNTGVTPTTTPTADRPSPKGYQFNPGKWGRY